jgi:hypothetical protein
VQVVVTGPTAPLFDYAAEVADAKLDFVRTEKELDLTPAVFAPPAQGEPLKNLKVAGVQLVNEPDPKRNMRTFGSWHGGYTLALSAELSGSALDDSVTSEVETAIADDGSSLLPTNESVRQSLFPRLSHDRTVVLFEVHLKLPGKAVSGLKEVSGHLQYKVSDGTKEVDLGFEELKEGAKGAALGAKIESIEEDILKDGGQEMELALDTPSGTIKSVSLIADGKKTVLDQHFSMGDDDVYIVTLTSEHPIPAKGRLSVEMYDNVRTFEVPFKLQNISLLGGSAAEK